MKNLNIPKLLAVLILVGSVVFNLWLYRYEPSSTVDPNDNSFQFGLVDRANTVWDFASKHCAGSLAYPACHLSYMVDHWVPNWAQGYNLPFYYSHIPQILIVGGWRLLSPVLGGMSLFTFYHVIIYILLCLMPLPVFFALRVMGFSWLTAAVGAITASHISTDGLYGMDQSSYLWRGWGLSSQLFATIWMPLAVAYIIRFFALPMKLRIPEKETLSSPVRIFAALGLLLRSLPREYYLAVLFTVLTTVGHLGMGVMMFLCLPAIAYTPVLARLLGQQSLKLAFADFVEGTFKLILAAAVPIAILSYWIVPTQLGNDFHNISFWDPIWKFDSYGIQEVLVNLANGDLLDFKRFPLYTILAGVGTLIGLARLSSFPLFNGKHASALKTGETPDDYMPPAAYPLSLLFVFWLLMYFGRTTWGPLIDLIPGMKEFHISRFVVGVHLVSMLLAPFGAAWVIHRLVVMLSGAFEVAYEFVNDGVVPNAKIRSRIRLSMDAIIPVLSLFLLVRILYPQDLEYANYNDVLIKQAAVNSAKVQTDTDKLIAYLRSLPPGRVFAGRGGGFGKDFRIAETPMYMYLSTYGIPTVLWLPETWSPNSDIEQYFSEDNAAHYDLFDIRYVVAPPSQQPQKFWKLLRESATWKVYEVQTSGYFTGAVSPSVVSSGKQDYANIVRLWIQSEYPAQKLYPEMYISKSIPSWEKRPHFAMTDEATYKTPDGRQYSLFGSVPVYEAKTPGITLSGETSDTDQIFSVKADVPDPCGNCMVVLKQSYHPGWKAWVDGKAVTPHLVFPFFTAVPVPPGAHVITMAYVPSPLKVFLMAAAFAGILVLGSAWMFSGTALANKRRNNPAGDKKMG